MRMINKNPLDSLVNEELHDIYYALGVGRCLLVHQMLLNAFISCLLSETAPSAQTPWGIMCFPPLQTHRHNALMILLETQK